MKYRVFCLLMFVLPVAAQTYSYSTLASFPAYARKGPVTPGVVIIDGLGNLYGPSQAGGSHGYGTVFKVTPRGAIVTLYNFGASATDGTYPWEPLTRDAAGNLYGVTNTGGSTNWGTMFKITSAGKETILHNFAYGTAAANLMRDPAGNLYGYDAGGYGSLFEYSATGVFSTLFEFCYSMSCDAAGDGPQGVPIKNRAGTLLGEVNTGAAYNCGGIFQMKGSTVSMLYSFDGASDGCGPWIKPTQDTAGNIYGVTYGGGPNDTGVVFKVSPAGVETVLYDFAPGITAESPVILDSAGNLYGIQGQGSSASIYKISGSGVFNVLAYSPGPVGLGYGLVIDKAGNLYGSTQSGGRNNTGAIYKLTKR